MIKHRIKFHLERKWLGVLSRFGNRLGIPISKLRIFFIYSTFTTLGLTFVMYLFLALLLWLKNRIVTKRPNVFDL